MTTARRDVVGPFWQGCRADWLSGEGKVRTVRARSNNFRTIAGVIGLFAAVCALRVIVGNDQDAILVLFIAPIAICAIEFGLVGGVVGAIVACLLVGVAGLTGAVSLGAVGYFSRLVPFLVVGGLLGRFVDARRALEAQVSRSEAISQDLLATAGFDGYFRRVNPAWESTLGHSPTELLSRPFVEFVHPDDIEATVQETAKLATVGVDTVNFRNRYRAKDGSYRWLDWNARAVEEDQLIYAAARDITERKRAEEEAMEARADAERANLAKSEFMSRMSHELRTPLNAILGFGQLLEMDELTPRQDESVATILAGGRHLLGLIDEILDISRIESGKMTLSPEPVDLVSAIRDVISLIAPLAAERGLKIDADLPTDSEIYVSADRQRLRQVMLNLLSNAVKYNREDGSIRISFATGTDHDSEPSVHIVVADTGPGIAPDQVERLFIPFERLGAEHTDVQGTGLGLALSRRLVELMGGTISVTSNLGEGSSFVVELGQAESVLVPEVLEAARKAGQASTPATGTLLYIEDNLSNLRLVEQIFAAQPGIRVISAMLGGLGLELAEQHRPDLILLDLHLPDLTGVAALERLKVNPRTRDIPVVILSADATEGQIRRLLQGGASDYLTKPLDVARFLDVVQRHLSTP